MERHILLTTSRKPAENIRTLCKDLLHTFPNIVQINRGKMSLEEVVAKAVDLNCKKVLFVERWNVGTCKVEFFEVRQDNLVGVPPIMYVHNVKFRRDFEGHKKRQTAKSIAIVTSSKRNFVKKIENAFARFFEIPIVSHCEAIDSKYNVIMQTSANISHGTSITFRRIPNFAEIGPRINVAQFVWK